MLLKDAIAPRPGIVDVLPPGLFALGTGALVAATLRADGDSQRAFDGIRDALARTDWSAGVAIFVLAYLLGSVARALSVSWADRICRSLFGWMSRSEKERLRLTETFPYPTSVSETLSAIQKNDRCLDVRPPTAGTEHTMYNLWKVELADGAPAAFAIHQELEARVRLFAGMFLAGLGGVAATLVGMLGCAAFGKPVLQPVLLVQLAITVAFGGVFGWRLRYVRWQEAKHLWIAHALLLEKEKREKDSGNVDSKKPE